MELFRFPSYVPWGECCRCCLRGTFHDLLCLVELLSLHESTLSLSLVTPTFLPALTIVSLLAHLSHKFVRISIKPSLFTKKVAWTFLNCIPGSNGEAFDWFGPKVATDQSYPKARDTSWRPPETEARQNQIVSCGHHWQLLLVGRFFRYIFS